MSETKAAEVNPDNFPVPVHAENGLVDMFAHAFEKGKETPVFRDDPVQRRQLGLTGNGALSFADLRTHVSHFSAYVQTVGLKPGDTIICQLPNTAEHVVLMLGALDAGLNVAPVPFWWRRAELDPWITALQPQALLTVGKAQSQNYSERFCQLAIDQLSIRFIFGLGTDLADGVSPLEPVLDGNYPANASHAIQGSDTMTDASPYTLSDATPEFGQIVLAGAEGQPVFHGIPQLMATAKLHRDVLDLGSEDSLLNSFPLSGLSGLGGILFAWLASGATLHLHHPFDLDGFVTHLLEHEISYTCLPPRLGGQLLTRYSQGGELENLRKLSFLYHPHQTDEPVNVPSTSSVEQFDILNLNEWALPIRRRPGGDKDDGEAVDSLLNALLFQPVSVTGQHPIECRFKGRFRQGHPSSGSNVKGRLFVRGDSVGRTQAAVATKISGQDARSVSAWTDTGLTCVPAQSSGDEISFLSPHNHIVSGSVLFEAEELDCLYQSYPDFADVAVFSRNDPIFGRKLCAAYVPAAGCRPGLVEFISHMRARDISPLKLPDTIFAVDMVPRSPGGDVDRSELERRFSGKTVS